MVNPVTCHPSSGIGRPKEKYWEMAKILISGIKMTIL